MSEYRPKVWTLYSLGALGFMLFSAAVLLPAAPSTNLSPLIPRLPVARLTAPASGGVTLKWNKGEPPETIVTNLTTRTAIYAGLADAVMFAGLELGSTNRFQAFNTNADGLMGFTPVVTGLATTQDLRCTIKLYTYLVTVPVRSNQLTVVMTSTNLVTWYNYAFITQTNPTYSFQWTNDGTTRFFRSTLP